MWVSAVGSSMSLRSVGITVAVSGAAAEIMEVRTPSGLTSRKTLAPCSARNSTASPNRTASRTCRTQYEACVASSANLLPVRVETSFRRGGEAGTEATISSNSPSTSSIW
ncbi:Uncharacterised protein [Mycobacterium tuberculosis]|nr:Uncharacterised protein [Mycobacterium tuberculosis]